MNALSRCDFDHFGIEKTPLLKPGGKNPGNEIAVLGGWNQSRD